MSKHTPGPWLYIPCGDEAGTDHMVSVGDHETYAPTEADARLIAAAPDLLEAAKGVFASRGPLGGEGFWESLQALRDAIARAEGRRVCDPE